MPSTELFPKITNLVTPEDTKLKRYKMEFQLQNSNVALANALRRSMLSEIPNVGFDLSGDNSSPDNNIYIRKNSSVLHNEFLAHRIAMTPICTYQSGELNIMSEWNEDRAIREHRFLGKVPEFNLRIQNTQEYQESLQASTNPTMSKKLDKNTVKVHTDDFRFEADEVADIRNFIVPDNITGDYIYLDKLKTLPDGSGEAIDVRGRLSIGTGKVHSLYSPVGTVAYHYVQSAPPVVEQHRQLYLQALQQERSEKGLKPYTEAEIVDINHTYDHLEAKRVYQRNAEGEPDQFQFTVESVGGMYPLQIMSFAIQGLLWKTRDIRRCLELVTSESTTDPIKYQLNAAKLSIVPSPGKMSSYDIQIDNEDHTMGNLLSKCLAEMYSHQHNQILSFVSYTKIHPLEDKISLRIQVNPDLDLLSFWDFVREQAEGSDNTLAQALADVVWPDSWIEDGTLAKFTTLFMFDLGLQSLISVLNRLLREWETVANPIIDQGCTNKNFIRYGNEATVQEQESAEHLDGSATDNVAMYQKILQFSG